MANNASLKQIPLLMTRPRAASVAFVARLPREILKRVRPVYSPLITIEPLDVDISVAPDEAAIFTSANGVAHGPDGNGAPAYCVGQATTDAARVKGWDAHMLGETADALVTSLTKTPPHHSFRHFSGVHTRGNICARLSARGISARHVAVYDQIAQELSADAHAVLASGHPVVVPLFSPRTSAQFALQAPRSMPVVVVALSKAVAQNVEAASYGKVIVASAPDAGAMSSAIAAVVSDLPAG